METVSRNDENSLRIEKEPPVVIICLEEILLQLEDCQRRKSIIEQQIIYYTNLLNKANEFDLRSKFVILDSRREIS